MFAAQPKLVDGVQHLCDLVDEHDDLASPLEDMLDLRLLVPWLMDVAGGALSLVTRFRGELAAAESQATKYREGTDGRIAMLEAKIEQDKGLLNTLKESYRVKLDLLEREKSTIVGQTHSFAQGLDQL